MSLPFLAYRIGHVHGAAHDASERLSQLFARAPEPSLDRADGHQSVAGDLFNRLAVEVERFEQVRVRARQLRESPTDDRGRLGRQRREPFVGDVNRRRVDRLGPQLAKMADERVVRYAE